MLADPQEAHEYTSLAECGQVLIRELEGLGKKVTNPWDAQKRKIKTSKAPTPTKVGLSRTQAQQYQNKHS